MSSETTYKLKIERAPGQAMAHSPQFALSVIFKVFEDLQLTEQQRWAVIETLISLYMELR